MSTKNSSDFIKDLRLKYLDLSYNELQDIYEHVFEYMKTKLKDGYRVEIRGFGVFEVRKHEPKECYNPISRVYEQLKERFVICYKTSSILHQRLNQIIN